MPGLSSEQLTPSRHNLLLATCGQRPGNEQLPFAGLQQGFQSAWSIFINSFEAMSGGWCSHQTTNASATGLGSFHTQLEFKTPNMVPEKLSWFAQTVPPTEASAQRGGTVSPITGFCAEGFGDACREVDAGHSPGLPARHSSLSLMPSGPDRLSLQSVTSRGTADRAMSQAEAYQSLATSSCSMHSLKGNKTTSPNQDRAMVATLCRGGNNSEANGTTDLLAVFDGHGEGGHWVSETCCEALPKLLLRRLAQASSAQAAGSGGQASGAQCSSPTARNPQEADGRPGTEWWREAAIQAFEDMHAILETSTAKVMAREDKDEQLALEGDQREGGMLELSTCGQPAIDARTSGTTATVLLLLPSRRLLAAHVGDSRAVFGTRRRGPDRALPWRAIELTRDHKPDLPDERQRIEDTGAQVVVVGCPPHSTHRVFTPHQSWPSINMSRSLGDLHAHTQGLSSAAEANLVEQLWDPAMEEAVLILGSDGIWDVLDGLAAVELAAHARQQGNDPAAILAHEAYDRWNKRGLQGGYTDDITVIVKFL